MHVHVRGMHVHVRSMHVHVRGMHVHVREIHTCARSLPVCTRGVLVYTQVWDADVVRDRLMGHARILLSREELRQMSTDNDVPLAAGRGRSQSDAPHGPRHYRQQLLPPWDKLPGRLTQPDVPLAGAEVGAGAEATTRAGRRKLSGTESMRLSGVERLGAERGSEGSPSLPLPPSSGPERPGMARRKTVYYTRQDAVHGAQRVGSDAARVAAETTARVRQVCSRGGASPSVPASSESMPQAPSPGPKPRARKHVPSLEQRARPLVQLRDCEDASSLAHDAGQRAVAKILVGRDATARLCDDVRTAAGLLVRTKDPRDAAAKLRELRPWTGCVAQVGRPEIDSRYI